MAITGALPLTLKANAVADETQRLTMLINAKNQAQVSDVWINLSSQAEQDVFVQIANARYNAQVALVAALNAL